MPSVVLHSDAASEGQRSTPFDDLMLQPKVNGLHPSSQTI